MRPRHVDAVQQQSYTLLVQHIQTLSRKVSDDQDGFDDELAALRRMDQQVRGNPDEFYSGSLGSNMAKNRFDDVKPNERTMVRLTPIAGSSDGNYINANYIDPRAKFAVPFVYIATQAPMRDTMLDFWRMVFEHETAFIVMLCACKENAKVKSVRYWPERSHTMDLGSMTVTTLSERSTVKDLIYRTFLLRTNRGVERQVHHLQYVTWPDEGVPSTSAPLMEIIQGMGRSPDSLTAPIVVHCSGGVGRTGVFIALHILLAQFQLRQSLNIPRVVRFLKLCRTGMVQRRDQYLFLYFSVLREMERMMHGGHRPVKMLFIRDVSAPPRSSPTRLSAGPTPRPLPSRNHRTHSPQGIAQRYFPSKRAAAHSPESSAPVDRRDVSLMEQYLAARHASHSRNVVRCHSSARSSSAAQSIFTSPPEEAPATILSDPHVRYRQARREAADVGEFGRGSDAAAHGDYTMHPPSGSTAMVQALRRAQDENREKRSHTSYDSTPRHTMAENWRSPSLSSWV